MSGGKLYVATEQPGARMNFVVPACALAAFTCARRKVADMYGNFTWSIPPINANERPLARLGDARAAVQVCPRQDVDGVVQQTIQKKLGAVRMQDVELALPLDRIEQGEVERPHEPLVLFARHDFRACRHGQEDARAPRSSVANAYLIRLPFMTSSAFSTASG